MRMGRERLIAELRRIHAESDAGRGQVALLQGGITSGKTTMLTRLGDEALEHGQVLLTATAAEAERDLRFGVLEQLFLSPELPVDVARTVEQLIQASSATDNATTRIAQGVRAALMEVAQHNTVVLTIDDIQWADQESLQVLQYLQRRIRSSRVMIAMAEADGYRPSRDGARGELLRQPHFQLLRLHSFTRDDVRDLLLAEFGAKVSASLSDTVHAISGGNPLLTTALLEDYRHGDGGDEPLLGTAFSQALVGCLYRGDESLQRTAHAVAILGEHATPTSVAAMQDSELVVTNERLETLDQAGIIDGCRFRHPAARQAILNDLTTDERAELHRRAARLLLDDGAPAVQIAPHLLIANDTTAPWSIEVLSDAATAAGGSDDAGTAQYLDLARRGSVDERAKARLTAQLAAVLWRGNPAAADRHLPALRSAAERGQLDAHAMLWLARALARQGATEAAITILHELPPTEPDHAYERAVTFEWLTYWHPTVMASLLPNTLNSRDTGRPLTRVLNEGIADDSEAERILQSCQVGETILEAVICAVHALIHAGKVDRAAQWCDELLAEATRYRAATWRAVLMDLRAVAAFRLGDLAEANRLARHAMTIISPHSWGVGLGSPLSTVILATTAMGKLEDAASWVNQSTPPNMVHTTNWLHYLQARGHYYLAIDRVHAAVNDFNTAGELAKKWDLDFPSLTPWRGAAAQAYLRLGKQDRSRELIGEQLTRPSATAARVRGISLRVLALASGMKQRVPMLREAAELLQESGDRHELALMHADLSETKQALGDFNRARIAARRAMQLANGCRAGLLEQRLLPAKIAEAEMADSTDAAQLSMAELKVATLAALGHTNREIGRKLYITVSTVEQHLTRAYRKLNVNRRTDLPSTLPLDIVDSI